MKQELYADHFTHDASAYKRDIDVIKHYVDDASLFLSINTGRSIEECRNFVNAGLAPGGAFEFKDPFVKYLDREENGDRVTKITKLTTYLGESVRDHEIIAPTFTTYLNPKVEKSILSSYIEENIAKRSVAKKEMFAATDKLVKAVKKIEQTGRKLANNAISGAHVTPSTPLFNKTAHSTLTSTCRTTSAYGNANNEKFLSGNRHYYRKDIILNNITSVINSVDYAKLEALVSKYAIHIPTVQETFDCVKYSASLYLWDPKAYAEIYFYISKLNDLQRAAFVYTGDAYQLHLYNDALMRALVTKLSNKVIAPQDDPMSIIKKAPESYVNLAHQLCHKETKGIDKDYKKLKSREELDTLASTIENIAKTVYEYRDLIDTLWMANTVPASVARFPESIRRSALTSDTDSTIFTVQDWMIWYNGKISFDDRTHGVYVAMVFLASQTITHVLATMSANIGVIQDHMFKIAMKSEFTFDVFTPTQLGKHYFACISCQEGAVKKELEYEIKGAQLRSANAPRAVVEGAKQMMKDIIADVMERGEVSLYKYLRITADYERDIEKCIRNGELNYLRNGSIKDINSYAGEPEQSPYAHYYMWKEVFAPKYGDIPAPPYDTKKINVTTDTPTKFKAWLDAMEDKDLAERMRAYCIKNNKSHIGTFNMPREILTSRGIPKEIMDIVDFEKIKVDICKMFYIILETLGYYGLGDKMKRLASNEGF
jgi:hypothetical protein